MGKRSWTGLLCLAAVALQGRPVQASEPLTDLENTCFNPGGQGDPCGTASDCELNAFATLCVERSLSDPSSRRCEIPCEALDASNVVADTTQCSLGETCVQGRVMPGRLGYHCQPARFRMDLNLLDQCLVHFLAGTQPVLGNENACSLERNLSKLLDQNNDLVFNIFDMDLCVLAFLEQPTCDADLLTEADAGTIPGEPACEADDSTYCIEDEDCGLGLYCDLQRRVCQRDCGIVVSRETAFAPLDRQCSGALTSCNYSLGRCETVDLTGSTCQVDSECPSGAYCFLGQCAPNCYRSIDCPGNRWYCTINNKCRALPPPAADDFVFDPRNYAIRFGRSQLDLDGIQISDSSAIVILDLTTKREVRENPSVSFGYRLEIKYDVKLDIQCLKPFIDCSDGAQRDSSETEDVCNARQDDCIIDDTEEWIRPVSPFGTVVAQGQPRLRVELEEAVVDRLSAGIYTATVTSIYDNGDSHSIRVVYTKVTPSGEYTGNLTVYMRGVENALNANRPIKLALKLKVTDRLMRWNEIVATQASGNSFVDTTQGFLVVGMIHGNSSFIFSRGDALTTADNEIPIIGLYSPDIGRMRLIANIDIAADFCIDESGSCGSANSTALRVQNLFGRDIRREIQFFGPFDEATRRFHGLYREKILGLASTLGGDLTIEGGFILDQSTPDDSPVTPTLESQLPLSLPPVTFPTESAVVMSINALVGTACAAFDVNRFVSPANMIYLSSADIANLRLLFPPMNFVDEQSFDRYIADAGLIDPGRPKRIFPDMLTFEQSIAQGLGALGSDLAAQQSHLNIYDFLASRILPCDPNDPSPPPVCIDEDAARCGLALYQKAFISGWAGIDVGANPPAVADLCLGDLDCAFFPDDICIDGLCQPAVPPAPTPVGDQELFCVDTLSIEGCATLGNTSPDLLTLQEHNRFWMNLAQILLFAGDKERSDAFLTLYRNAENPFAEGAAISYKEERLIASLANYDAVARLIVDRFATAILWAWPMRDFKQVGNQWLSIMHEVMSRRMETIAGIVDLKRRVFLTADSSTRMLGQHMVQQEYLMQVFLMALQERWQQELFRYKGEAAEVFETAQHIVLQLDPGRNPIGVIADQTFFENSDTSVPNWVNYKNVTVAMISDARAEITGAVSNLKSSLNDLDTFEAKLRDARYHLEDKLNQICGDPQPPVGSESSFCDYLAANFADGDTWDTVTKCMFLVPEDPGYPGDASCNAFPGSPSYVCTELMFSHTNGLYGGNFDTTAVDDCSQTSAFFTDGTGEFRSACALDSAKEFVNVHGTARACVGGQVGALLQEKAQLDAERASVQGQMKTLLTNMKYIADHDDITARNDNEDYGGRIATASIQFILRTVSAFTADIFHASIQMPKAANCTIIAGFAFGTNCVGSTIEATMETVILGSKATVIFGLNTAIDALDLVIAGLQNAHDVENNGMDSGKVLLSMGLQAKGLVGKYKLLTQRSFNVHAKLQDARYQAQAAADRFADEVTFVADHLVGRESGSVLVGNHLVQESADTFRKLLQYAYRLAQAFSYHYNLSPGDTEQLANLIMAAVTVDDVEDFVDKLEDRALQYCGLEAIDCDSLTNYETLRFSLRDQLFSNLRDIVDARTGNVVTAGEQFHNLITQPPYLRRRIRGTEPTDQIEITISIALQAKENTPVGPRWLIDPLTCNHQLAGVGGAASFQGGNLAVNFLGHNLGDGSDGNTTGTTGANIIRYELIRGSADFMRSCRAESIQEEIGTLPILQYPIRTRLVGYAPQAEQALEDVPPMYVTRSAAFSGCINKSETTGNIGNAPCWRYFARDRSLSAPDWKMVIPVRVGGAATDSTWILGEGLPDSQRPIIEDIVMYFRYRTRPIAEF